MKGWLCCIRNQLLMRIYILSISSRTIVERNMQGSTLDLMICDKQYLLNV